MDFKLVLEKLLTAFKDQDIRYALMGGFAMGLWGGSRSTVDLDFLAHHDDMKQVHGIVTSLGYELHLKTDNVSQYTSPLKIFGGIDFIHAFREASVEMLQRAVEKDIFSGSLKIRTLIPADIIGMKLQAIYNNPSREKIDMADIELLVSVNNSNLDWELIRKYCEIFSMEELYRKLKESIQR
ncbi:MAG: hypothetical protein C4581_10530 [Nitrospiraceae bacterium]|nr:MAG: hypothetical protein C4581_10530 [Nitrospiraceae bacterium]